MKEVNKKEFYDFINDKDVILSSNRSTWDFQGTITLTYTYRNGNIVGKIEENEEQRKYYLNY